MSRNQKSPLIPKVRKEDKERVLINVPADVGADARLYAEYLNGDLSYVFTEALRYTSSRDAAFQAWRKTGRPQTTPPAGAPVDAPADKASASADLPVTAQHEPTTPGRRPKVA